MAADDLQVGQNVELSDGRPAVVRFVGSTTFSPTGIWVGVELEDHSGKNDGSVQGERYFDCEQGKGVFVRPTAITMSARVAMPPPLKPDTTKRSRPISVVPAVNKATNTTESLTAKRQSTKNASPTSGSRRSSSLLRSPSKSPTKQLSSSSNLLSCATLRTNTPSISRASSSTGCATTVSTKRVTTGSASALPPPRTVRQSLVSRAGPPPRPTQAQRLGDRPTTTRLSSHGSQVSMSAASEPHLNDDNEDIALCDEIFPSTRSDEPMLSPASRSISPYKKSTESHVRPLSSTSPARDVASITTVRTAVSTEVEDLKTKLRLLEKKRMEDREKLKSLEQVTNERNKFESIIQKLQTKYQPLQQDITDLRKQLKDAETKNSEVENMQADHDDALEMAALDREMAEENAEMLKTELDALKQRTEELELEVEILRAENEELSGEMSAEDKASQGWLQMERNNERLREALLRLRDISQETESELRDDLKSLEEENRVLSGFRERFEDMNTKLALSETNAADLRQQLDNALGAEDMIEELTERTMTMSEQIEEMRTTIEDLESLKELNDELEINHVETQKELQKDLDDKDALIAQQARHASKQNDTVDDLEYMLSRFRELVKTLQMDLEDLRMSHAVSETESEQLNSRSRAIMDLNLKLQLSATKTQAKTIDLELRRLEAQEASDHLAIVQLYLPEAYQTYKDAILALLRFKRVTYKANLLRGLVKDRITNHTTSRYDDDVFTACDVLDKLSWVKAMCDRFINFVSHCTVAQFAKFEGALYELEPVERALNGWIHGLRQDELKTQQCATELQRTLAVIAHLAEVHIADGLESYADDIYMRTTLVQNKLETTGLALATIKNMVTGLSLCEQADDDLPSFSKRLETMYSSTRSTMIIAGKAVRSVEDLRSRSLSLSPDTIVRFEECEQLTSELARFACQHGADLLELIHNVDRTDTATLNVVISTARQTAKKVLDVDELDAFSTFLEKLKILTTMISDLLSLTADLSQAQEFERAVAPWLIWSQELKQSKAAMIDTTEELSRLRDVYREKMRVIALREQTLEELTVKIELLESRMRDANKKTDKIHELEMALVALQKRESELKQVARALEIELRVSEEERARFQSMADTHRALETKPDLKIGTEEAIATTREMQSLKLEIAASQSALLYLREDNRLSTLSDHGSIAWLTKPLLKSKKNTSEIRKELVTRECHSTLHDLIGLCGDATLFDLSTLPANKLAWKSLKSTPTWHVGRQREDWVTWRAWSGSVLKRGRELRSNNGRFSSSDYKAQLAAQVILTLPNESYGKGVVMEDIHIVESGESVESV